MPVLDASVVVEFLTEGRHFEAASALLRAEARTLKAPHLLDAEVGHALRRVVSRGELRATAGQAALGDLAELPLLRVAHTSLLERAWALRANLTFYDGLYVALAERFDEPLITLDARLAGAPGLRADVIVLR